MASVASDIYVYDMAVALMQMSLDFSQRLYNHVRSSQRLRRIRRWPMTIFSASYDSICHVGIPNALLVAATGITSDQLVVSTF
ncbi:MAG: hypothetical protein R3F19_04545 [Verrucomicrobiales bacterium]